MHRRSGLIPLVCVLLAQAAAAGEIYRYVDAQGNVTYSDVPPAAGVAAEQIELPPPPSVDTQRHTEQRNLQIQRAAEQADRQRRQQKQEREARVDEAKAKLKEAEDKLSQAKEIRDEDRQNLAGGKRRINPDYFERVKQAEAEVEAARKALQSARGY